MDTSYEPIRLGTVASTQREARERFMGPPLLVTAERQTGGRGRSGNTWVHAPRAVAASLAFHLDWPREAWGLVTLVAGLAAADVAGSRAGLAWPNDVVAGGRKIGGLLTEAAGDVIVVGLGLNLWWPDPMDGAGALYDEDPGAEAAVEIADRWAAGALRRASAGPMDWGKDEYRDRCVTIGATVTWSGGGPALACDVADDGALVVESGGVRTSLHAGEVRKVRPA
jgi:BirA family biotin operon repressor/biotin-[acetyl-CoA-carboxylase] ligase